MNQKLENILNLALETSETQRERTGDLNVGFDSETQSWELIVKYHGELSFLETEGIGVEYLIAGYAILTVPENLVDAVSGLEQIEYVEKPKRYYYSMDFGEGLGDPALQSGYGPAESMCFATVTFAPPYLSGEGCLIAILDSGIAWERREFRNADGSTRIQYLWDQTLDSSVAGGNPPQGFRIGVEFDRQQINEALQASDSAGGFSVSGAGQGTLLTSIDSGGHGTAVAGIAAGALREASYLGAAPRAGLLIVKLGLPREEGFPRTTEIMRAVTWALQKAQELQQPLVINLSFGNSYGAHDGGSLLERFLDNAAEIGRTVICVGSGNEGSSGGHVGGNVFRGTGTYEASVGTGRLSGQGSGSSVARRTAVELAVGEYERNLRVQFWQNYSDVYRVYLRSPGGVESELTAPVNGGKFTLTLEQTNILAYQGEPLPYAVAKELYLEMLPTFGQYINSGIWTITIDPVRVVTGQYYFYLSDSATRNARTLFYNPTPQVTLTVPSTAAKVLTVGAYNAIYDSYADFSGRGYADPARTIGVVTAGLAKPDLVAPGVNILAPDIYGSYRTVTGTSFATPIVAGAAALLMEWGIVRGNDPFLYGEKVKAYLRKGAQPLRGETEYPNERVGWGALCVRESLPG